MSAAALAGSHARPHPPQAAPGAGATILLLPQAHTAAQRAFEALVERHRAALRSYCRKLCRNSWDGEDLLQECFARAYSRLPLVRQAEDTLRYLKRMAKNCWLDGERRSRSLAHDPLDPDLADPLCGSPDESVAVRRLLQRILSTLNPRQAAVLLLTAAGFNGVEIAEKLDMTHGSVRIEISRARTRLRQGSPLDPASCSPLLDSLTLAYADRDVVAWIELLAAHAGKTSRSRRASRRGVTER